MNDISIFNKSNKTFVNINISFFHRKKRTGHTTWGKISHWSTRSLHQRELRRSKFHKIFVDTIINIYRKTTWVEHIKCIGHTT